MSSLINSIDHLVIEVQDLDDATRDYELLLGREPSWKGRHPEMGTENTLFKLSNTYVELLLYPENGTVQRSSGFKAMALGTEDIDGFAAVIPGYGPFEGHGINELSGARRDWRTYIIDEKLSRGVGLFAIEHISPAGLLPDSKSASDSPVTGIDHVVLFTTDADDSISLFKGRLGMDLRLDKQFDDLGARLIFFRTTDAVLEVAHLDSQSADALWGISYRVDDVDAARARLLDWGFVVSEVKKGRRPGTRVCTVKSRTHNVETLLLERERPD